MLLPTWGSENRIVSQPLQTTWKREFFYISSTNKRLNYFLYTRIRTKQYRYVGMDLTTAIECAKEKNALYNRQFIAQYYDENTIGDANHYVHYLTQQKHKIACKQCGNAVIRQEAGDSYAVDVQVNEELEYKYGRWNLYNGVTESYTPWTEFETNPNMDTWIFRGWKLKTPYGEDLPIQDFDYDESEA